MRVMDLATYVSDLSEKKKVPPRRIYEHIARLIGVNPYSVWRYTKGKQIPRRDFMQRITEVTGGKVRPQDFYRTK